MREVAPNWKITDAGRAGEWFCNYKKGVTGATGEGFSGTQRMTNVTYIMQKMDDLNGGN